MLLRQETEADRAAVAEVVTLAFGREDEARLVAALRRDAAFIPALSIVAEQDAEVVGHILFSSATIIGEAKQWPALALAPLAVRPPWQHQGVGSALTRHGLQECRRFGHSLVVVLGHAEYYPRFGFTSAHAAGIAAPFPVRSESFMAIELAPGTFAGVGGTIQYAAPFAGL